MARFSVGGDEDGNDERERPNNDKPFPKRPRIGNPIVYIHKRTTTTAAAAAAAAASTSNSGSRATTFAAAATTPPPSLEPTPRPEEESEEQSSDESETSWSDTSSDTSSESDEEEVPQQQQEVTTVARVDSAANRNDASEGSSGPVSVTLTDPDVLDCPICYEPLCSPVYQCDNGHIACASCCNIMKNKCANCCWPIGYNRCRAIEKVLDSVRIACRNTPYGCMETLNYSKKFAHEKTCNFAPCSCPYIGCNYAGTSTCVYSHFAQTHPHSSKQFHLNVAISISLDNNQKHVFLQERRLNVVFILNRSIETLGSFVNVVCVAPTSEKRAFLYELTATVGESSIRYKTRADFMPKWTAQPPAKRYLVPNDFIRGQLKLELTIWRDPALAS